MNESSQDNSKSTAAPLYLQEVACEAIPNAIPLRSAKEDVNTFWLVPVPASTSISAQTIVASVHVGEETIMVTT